VNVRWLSSGQQRRAEARAKKARTRKINRNHRRDWMRKQWSVAVLRGQLQAVGVLPYVTDHEPTTKQRVDGGQWLVRGFGERNDEGELILSDTLVEDAIKAAAETYAEAMSA
jgi:hypothetical protein